MAPTFSYEATVFFASVVGFWALMRPSTIKDAEGRALPANMTARTAAIVLYLLGYLGLVAGFVFCKDSMMRVVQSTPEPVLNVFRSVENQAPLLALFALFGMNSLAPFREAERAVVVWLHSMQHLHGDAETLLAHLQTCSFTPSLVEQQKNIDHLARHNIYLTDADTQQIDLTSVVAWRKVTSMIRLLHQWNTAERQVLSGEQRARLEEIEKSHTRKTRLATETLKMLSNLSRGAGPAFVLAELRTLLADMPHSDRHAIAEVESKLKAIMARREDAPATPDQPVRLSSQQFREFMSQIDGYFRVEYQILLSQVADLTARSVVYSADRAPKRLRELKEVGFADLGRIIPFTFDRVLWTCILVTIGGFMIMYELRYADLSRMQDANPRGILASFLVFSLTMALASMVGAAVGSNRQVVQAEFTPWAWYVVAGLGSVALFFAAHAARLMLTTTRGVAPGQVFPFDRFAPWALLPLVLTIVICRLARTKHWPTPPLVSRIPLGANAWERGMDGTVVAIAMYGAYGMAIIAHEITGLTLPPSLSDAPWNPNVFAPTMLLGFLIGSVVVRDTRHGSQASIVQSVAMHHPASAQAPVMPPVMPSATPHAEPFPAGAHGAGATIIQHPAAAKTSPSTAIH